jgi:hypothetical protein
MPSSGGLRRVAIVRSDVSEKRVVSIIKVTRIGELRRVSSDADDGFNSFLRNVGSYKSHKK